MPSKKITHDYDSEVADMMRLATALTNAADLPKLINQSAGFINFPEIIIVATATQEDKDADT